MIPTIAIGSDFCQLLLQLADGIEALVFNWADRVSRWTAVNNKLYFDFFAE